MSGAHVAVGLVAVAWLAGTAGLCVACRAAGRHQGYAERDAELDERFGWAPEVVHEPPPIREVPNIPTRVPGRIGAPGIITDHEGTPIWAEGKALTGSDADEAWLRSVGWGGAA